MRNGLVFFTAVVASMLALAAPPASAADGPEVNATLQVMGYGYKVTVLVNGADTGIRGGQSEGRRLFGKTDPMAAKASPEVRARNFVLERGENEFVIEYSKLDPKSDDALEILVESKGYPQPLIRLDNKRKASDKVSVKVAIEPRAPPSFKPVVIGETK